MLSLPPGLQTLSTHTFGSLSLQIVSIKTPNNLQLTHYMPQFFGQPSQPDQNINISNQYEYGQIGEKMKYKIVTNLWMFYLYMSDMEYLTIHLKENRANNQRGYNYYVRVPIGLKSAKQVMMPEYWGPDIMKTGDEEICTIVDSRGNTHGTVTVKIQTQFNQQIHKQIKQLVNFNELVIFQGISPINSETELPREPPQQMSATIANSNSHNQTQITEESRKNYEQFLGEPMESSIRARDAEEECADNQDFRIMEEDIDKLIMEMQAKPYDCSRYQENNSKEESHERGPNINSHQGNISVFSKNSDHKFHNSNRFVQTEASFKHSMARPPTYSPTPRPLPKIDQQQTVITKSPRLLKSTQSLSQSSTGPKSSHSSSYIQLKIHQMLASLSNAMPHTLFEQLMQPCYTLKLYLNNDQEQYFAAQGIKQGEIVVFNQSLKIRNVTNLNSLRFAICDDYGKVQCQGVFDLARLYASKELKGVFTVPLIAFATSALSRLSVSENKLLEVSPLHRTLRLEAELVEKIQMVQIFIKISKVSIPSSMIRYKVPMTKQTIEHIGDSHVNIFPHTCSQHTPDKIILEFWRNEQNIGQSQISLKNIKNTNSSALASSVDPVYLYDGRKQIRNILEGDRVVGDFVLTLCFGTVKQMQALLLGTINEERLNIQQDKNTRKAKASLDQRLGVLVYEKKQSNEISVQVEIQPEKEVHELVESRKENGQLFFGDQSIISHTSHNEFMEASLVSFAKHQQSGHSVEIPPAKIQQKTIKPAINYETVTEKISKNIASLLQPLIPCLAKLKQQCKPHLVYNFIPISTLKQILLSLGLKNKLIEQIFKLALFSKGEMTNVNILYDLITSAELEGRVRDTLVGDQMLIVGALRLLYGREGLRGRLLLESEMEFKEMADMFKLVELRLTLHQFNTLDKFVSKYKTKKDAQDLKAAIISELQSQTIVQVQQCFYQQDILKQIYGDDSSSNMSGFHNYSQQEQNHHEEKLEESVPKFTCEDSFRQTVEKPAAVQAKKQIEMKATLKPKQKEQQSYGNKMSIQGIQNTLDSLQCIFDPMPQNLALTLSLQSPIKKDLTFQLTDHSKQFTSSFELKDADGKVYLTSKNEIIASAAFSLIKGVKSLYALKSNQGEFCGLLHLLLE